MQLSEKQLERLAEIVSIIDDSLWDEDTDYQPALTFLKKAKEPQVMELWKLYQNGSSGNGKVDDVWKPMKELIAEMKKDPR